MKSKYRHLKFFLISALSLLPVACGSSSNNNNGGTSTSVLSAAFGTNCAPCHGAAGGGGSGANLTGYTRSKMTFEARVRSGGGSMPAFSTTQYTDADLMADYTYLISN